MLVIVFETLYSYILSGRDNSYGASTSKDNKKTFLKKLLTFKTQESIIKSCETERQTQ